MENMQEDMEDSRTSAVGRKRNLEETQDEGLATPRHSSLEDDAQRASKRVRDTDESLEDSIILNTASPLRVASPSRWPTNAAPVRAGAWNRGVQSGLRISFGKRAQSQPKAKSMALIHSSLDEAAATSTTVSDTTTLPQKHTSQFPNEDEGADTIMADTMEQLEQPLSVPLSQGEEEDGPVAQTDRTEMRAGTTSEEEGEIPSSRDATNCPEMLLENPSVSFGRDAVRESFFMKGAVGNANSFQPQLPHLLDRGDGKPAGHIVEVDYLPRETAARLRSSSPDAVEAHSDVDAAAIDAGPVWKGKAVNSVVTILSGAKEAQVILTEKNIYLQAKDDKSREQQKQITLSEKVKVFERRTSEAEAIFEHEVKFLPSNYQAIKENIAAGLTFLPRQIDHSRPIYRKKNINYTIMEVLKGGKPIQIQDLTLDIFAPSFLKDNQNEWDSIKPKVLSAAFNSYRLAFYSPDAIACGGPNASNMSHDVDFKTIKEAQEKSKELPIRLPPREHTFALLDVKRDLPPEDTTEINELELSYQVKYFPSPIDRPATYHCLTCGENCHMTVDCASLTCTLCDGDHPQFACPQNRRCQRCRQRGHDVAECPEKLGLSKDEKVGCDFCGSTDHVETHCNTIWRTFHPKSEEIRRVRSIPIYCYICGGDGHYGPECGLYKECPLLSGGHTWSKANLLQYVDASSADRAMSASIDYSIKSKPSKQFSIKGKAHDPIDLNDSDDDDVTFLHEKFKGPKNRGQLKIAGIARRIPQPANVSRAPNPPRDSRPDFGRNSGRNGLRGGVDSARHGRERTFSPPPRYSDLRYEFHEAEDSHRQQTPYRSQPPHAQKNYKADPQGALPVRQTSMISGNVPKGGRAGRGSRAQNGGNNAQGGGGGEGQSKKKKRSERRGGTRRDN